MKESGSGELARAIDGQRSSNRAKATGASGPVSRRHIAFRRLIEACKRKDIARLKLGLSEKPELANQRDEHNRTLLHYTAILMRAGSQGNEGSDEREQEVSLRSIECLDYLTDRCDLRLWWQQDLDGLSLLHLAVISSNVSLVEHVIYRHAYSAKYPLVCTLDNELHSPLHWAVITDSLECVQFLVGFAGSKLANEPDLNGATPLHYATQTNDYPKYRQQLRHMLKCVGDSGDTFNLPVSSHSAQSNDDLNELAKQDSAASKSESIAGKSADESSEPRPALQVLEYLVQLPQVDLECPDKDKRTPLLWAASSGNRDALLLLIRNGADAASCDANRLSALHCAASHGFTECLECLLNLAPPPEGSQVQVNQADSMNCTPLFYAVLSGNIDCVESLLERGADCDWRDAKGRTAAHFAALRGQLNSLKLLKERGANLWLPNRQGDLPLHYAIKSGRQQVVRWLLDHSPYEHSVNAINNYGRAPIHLAIARNNRPLLEYLIKCGANLNQLVKVRSKAHFKQKADLDPYETALDLAKRLSLDQIVQTLLEKGAQSAPEVIANRSQLRQHGKLQRSQAEVDAQDTRSLFELQSVTGPSPIGPSETSETGTSITSGLNQPGTPAYEARVPKLGAPSAVAADALPQTDSTGTSSMSQNSLTSLRGLASERGPRHEPSEKRLADVSSSREDRSYRGGISYKNELINASIKCKLYDREHHSFPVSRRSIQVEPESSESRKAMVRRPASSGQKVITNVNVYTPPCAHCSIHDLGPQQLDTSNPRQASVAEADRRKTWDTDETSSQNSTASSVFSETREQVARLLPSLLDDHPPARAPKVAAQSHQHAALPLVARHLPPSQGLEQRLPVILSDQERSASTASSMQERPDETESPAYMASDVRRSPADEEPRFDLSDRASKIQHQDKLRYQVRSPVADYIRQSRQHRFASRSQTPHQPSRSSSRNQRRTNSRAAKVSQPLKRSSSSESFDLTTRVEKSIRKFRQEKKVFEELQNLKRCQIRSGRANESLLVKRLVEHFKLEAQNCADMIGLEQYHGSYDYLSYERFLYNQLRKLSPTNSAKLSGWPDDTEPTEDAIESADQKYLDEDLEAELELRRVIGEDNTAGLSHTVDGPERGKETVDLLVMDQPEVADRRASITSISSSRRSSVDVEREKLLNLPLNIGNLGVARGQEVASIEDIERQAESLSSSILVDALGNISRSSSAKELAQMSDTADETPTPEEVPTGSEVLQNSPPKTSDRPRRLSVINIGNKIETVEHDVGIEIERAESLAASSDQELGSETSEVEGDKETSSEIGERALSAIDEHEDDNKGEPEDGNESASESAEASTEIEVGPAEVEQDQTEPVAVEQEQEEVADPEPESPVVARAQVERLRRRVSSPHLSGDGGERDRSSRSSRESRRASSGFEPTERKVFNGYDLDEMRAKYMRRRARSKRESRARQPRKGRSRLPELKYVPRVDLESVRNRWRPIKSEWRRHKSPNDPLVGPFGLVQELAKSQPDLGQPEGAAEPDEVNYVLLYEINKGGDGDGMRAEERAGGLSGAEVELRWCQRRVVRIVDVRTLKRTLSLPESLMYSNDLLKRFNLLKL